MASAPDPHALDRLAWLDLEMTGLDVSRHVIVELGVLVTDADLEPLDDGFNVIIHQPPEALAQMDDFVRNMHTKSGLLPAIEAAGAQAIEYLRAHVGPGVAPMCGNSIGVDRRFLHTQLMDLDEYLHYRSIDVSSLKELCRRWYPDVYKQRPGKKEAHRALDDVLESIAELKFYREAMLKPPATPDAPA